MTAALSAGPADVAAKRRRRAADMFRLIAAGIDADAPPPRSVMPNPEVSQVAMQLDPDDPDGVDVWARFLGRPSDTVLGSGVLSPEACPWREYSVMVTLPNGWQIQV